MKYDIKASYLIYVSFKRYNIHMRRSIVRFIKKYAIRKKNV